MSSHIEVSKVLDSLNVTITALTSWKDDETNLLLGTVDGTIIHYHPDVRSFGRPHLVATGRVSKKDITQLAVANSFGLCIILTNSTVYIDKINPSRYPSAFFNALPPFKESVYCFSYEQHHSHHLLATCHRKE
ncbi:hypothetical protein GEMRC1_006650 [Eukaryota sp. GEM-RC1]